MISKESKILIKDQINVLQGHKADINTKIQSFNMQLTDLQKQKTDIQKQIDDLQNDLNL